MTTIVSLLLAFLWFLWNIATASGCIDNIQVIFDIETTLDPSSVATPREYILCPDSVHETNLLDENLNPIPGTGSSALFLRSNAIIKCGSDGSRSNGCVIQNGSVGMDTTYSPSLDAAYGLEGLVLENARIEGVTFKGFRGYGIRIWGYMGHFEFKDCAFLENTLYDIISIAGRLDIDSVNKEIRCGQGGAADDFTVTFSECLFEDNASLAASGGRTTEALIVGLCDSQTLVIRDSIFRNNDFTVDATKPNAALVLNRGGGGLVMECNCFANNQLKSVGPALSYHTETQSQPQVSNNYADTSTPGVCAFLTDVVVDNFVDYSVNSTECLTPDLSFCPLWTPAPTTAPTNVPTTAPTNAPTTSPTNVPTTAPTDALSKTLAATLSSGSAMGSMGTTVVSLAVAAVCLMAIGM